MAKPDRLEDLSSLGVVSARMLREIGVESPDHLRQRGLVDVWRGLKFHFGRRVTLNFLYALDAAIRDVHWRDIDANRKLELKRLATAIAQELASLDRPPRDAS